MYSMTSHSTVNKKKAKLSEIGKFCPLVTGALQGALGFLRGKESTKRKKKKLFKTELCPWQVGGKKQVRSSRWFLFSFGTLFYF